MITNTKNRIKALLGEFRFRRIFYTAISSVGLQGLTMLVSLISLPLTLGYLGDERFGMMMTVVSVFAFISFADLGLGYGLQNRLPDYEKDAKKLHSAVSSIFFTLLVISCFCILLFYSFYTHIEWHKIFNVSSSIAISEAPASALAFFICLMINVPLSIVQRVQNGFQEGYYNNFWISIGSVIGLCILYISIIQEAGVPTIIYSIYGINSLFLLFNFLNQFIRKRRNLFPSIKLIDLTLLRVLISDGLYFSFIQLLFLISNMSDSLIIAQLVGPTEVTVLTIGLKMITIFTVLSTAIMTPALPAINDALAKMDYQWVRNLFLKGSKASFLSSIIFATVFILTANFLITLWLGNSQTFDTILLLSFAAYLFFYNLTPFYSFFMMSKPLYRKLSKLYPIAVLSAIVTKFIACSYFGLSGLLLAATFTMLLVYIYPSHKIISQTIK